MDTYYKGEVVLVTGGTGFIGAHLVDRLISLKVKKVIVTSTKKPKIIKKGVTYIVCDSGNISKLLQILTTHKPTIIYHLSGKSSIEDCTKDPIDAYRVNVHGTLTLYEAIRLSHVVVKRIIVASSYKVYTQSKEVITEESPVRASTIYEATMLAKEHISSAYVALYNFPITVVRIANVYSNYTKSNTRLINTVLRLFLDKKSPTVFSHIARSRANFIYIKDLIEALLFITTKQSNFLVNVGGSENITILSLVKKIQRTLKTNTSIVIQGSNKEKELHRDMSISALAKLGWKPRYTLTTGLQEIIKDLKH